MSAPKSCNIMREMQRSRRPTPCGPLKEHYRMANGNPKCIRDTPMVPKGTVADIGYRMFFTGKRLGVAYVSNPLAKKALV